MGAVSRVAYSPLSAARGEFRHFMLKEMHDQPEATIDGLRGRVSFDRLTVDLEGFPYTDDEVKSIERVVLTGMGEQSARCDGGPLLDRVAGPHPGRG